MTELGLVVNARNAAPDATEIGALGLTTGWIRTIVYDWRSFGAYLEQIDQRTHVCALLNSETDGVGSDYAGWERAVRDFVQVFKGRVAAVECGNELDILNVPVSVAAELVKVASPMLRAAGMKVILSSVAGPGWVDYLERLAAATKGYADYAGLHPYVKRAAGFPDYPDWGELSDAIVTANEKSGLPVALTEYGIKIGDAGGSGGQAKYVARSIELLQATSSARCPFACYFAWRDDIGGPDEHGQHAFGLRETGGFARVAWQAFAVAMGVGAPLVVPPPPMTPPVGPPPSTQPGFEVGGGIRALCAARGWTVASHEDYSQPSHSETLVLTPDGPRIASYWHAAKQLYVGPTLEVAG